MHLYEATRTVLSESYIMQFNLTTHKCTLHTLNLPTMLLYYLGPSLFAHIVIYSLCELHTRFRNWYESLSLYNTHLAEAQTHIALAEYLIFSSYKWHYDEETCMIRNLLLLY